MTFGKNHCYYLKCFAFWSTSLTSGGRSMWWITMHGRSMNKPYGSQVTYLVLFLHQKNAPRVVGNDMWPILPRNTSGGENNPHIVKDHLCIVPILVTWNEKLRKPETLMTEKPPALGHDVWACRSLEPGQRWELEDGVVARWICWILSAKKTRGISWLQFRNETISDIIAASYIYIYIHNQ